MDELLIAVVLVIATLVLVFPSFYFAKRFGSRLAFLSMGYGVFVLTLCGAGIVYWASYSFDAIYFLYPLIVLFLPGYIMLSTLIYFFWPARFEPNFDDSIDEIRRFKKWLYFAWITSFLVLFLVFSAFE